MDAESRLRVIAEKGAPAQSAEARRLLRLADDGVDVSSHAGRLWDAYLNDPYLERG